MNILPIFAEKRVRRYADGDRILTRRDEAIVENTIHCFDQYRLMRDTFGSHWEEISELIDPPSRQPERSTA